MRSPACTKGASVAAVRAFAHRVFRQQEELSLRRVHELSRWFARSGAERGPVKVSIALLGVTGSPKDEPLLTTLARHEELTLFCAAALSNLLDDPETALWGLAKNVEGQARVDLVQQLAETSEPAIKRWLLREGFRSSVGDEHSAYICAVGGELHVERRREGVEPDLLEGAGGIIRALLSGRGRDDINDYDHANEVVERYAKLSEAAPLTEAQQSSLESIRAYLGHSDLPHSGGWSLARQRRVLASVRRALRRPIKSS